MTSDLLNPRPLTRLQPLVDTNAFAASLRHSCWLYIGTKSLDLGTGASNLFIGPRMRLAATSQRPHTTTARPSHTTAYRSDVHALLRLPPSATTSAHLGECLASATTGPSRTSSALASSHKLRIAPPATAFMNISVLFFSYRTPSHRPLNCLAALRTQRSSLEDPTKEDGDGDEGRIAGSSRYTRYGSQFEYLYHHLYSRYTSNHYT
jgi:hypothetical protein